MFGILICALSVLRHLLHRYPECHNWVCSTKIIVEDSYRFSLFMSDGILNSDCAQVIWLPSFLLPGLFQEPQ